MIKHATKAVMVLGACLLAGNAQAATPVDLDALLEQVKTGRVKDAEQAQIRLDAFRLKKRIPELL